MSGPMVRACPIPSLATLPVMSSDTGLPAEAHVVVINDNNSNPVLYDLSARRHANADANPATLQYRVNPQRRIRDG